MSPARTGDAPGAAVEDPTLPLPDPPALAEPLGSLDHPLRESLAADAAFRLTGRGALAEGRGAAGVDRIRSDGAETVRGLRIEGAVWLDATRTPLGVERRVRVGSGLVVERTAVPRDAPACIVEWLSETPAEVRVRWTCGSVRRWRRTERGLVVASEDALAAFLFSAPPASLEAGPATRAGSDALRVQAGVRLEPNVPLRLAVAGGRDLATIQRGLEAVDRAGGIARARRGHAERLRRELVSLDAPDEEAARALEWAEHDLDARIREAPAGDPAAARAALDCLAGGAFREARDALVSIGRQVDRGGETAWLHLLLAARYLAWTGDFVTLRREWARVVGPWRAGAAPGDVAGGLPGSALAELANAAESIGEGDAGAELREAAAARGGVAWAAETGGRSAIRRVVHGILGAEPDAARGRLVLRPEPPPGWERFAVSGLRVGEAALAVDYQATGGRHAFRLAQRRGSAPLRVILEPSLPGSRLLEATVDGVPAELDTRQGGDRLRVPVQVVLDHDRKIVLELEERTEMEGGRA